MRGAAAGTSVGGASGFSTGADWTGGGVGSTCRGSSAFTTVGSGLTATSAVRASSASTGAGRGGGGGGLRASTAKREKASSYVMAGAGAGSGAGTGLSGAGAGSVAEGTAAGGAAYESG